MSKKVFSIEKFREWKERRGDKDWWEICDGLTEEEMAKLGFTTSDSWMVEVEMNKYQEAIKEKAYSNCFPVYVNGTCPYHNQNIPTEEEIKKEWEEKGWKITIYNCEIEIEIEDTKSFVIIYIDRKDKMFWSNHYLPFNIIQLLTKTFKWLGWE